MIHPLLLGCGQRLFDHDGNLAKLQLVDSTVTSTGVILATYQPSAPRRKPYGTVSCRTRPTDERRH